MKRLAFVIVILMMLASCATHHKTMEEQAKEARMKAEKVETKPLEPWNQVTRSDGEVLLDGITEVLWYLDPIVNSPWEP